ncbi:MAG: serine--tRNA ligase [Acidobacteriota bacterium]|jgi:seryl-tRNA synthetase|nr:serine--tRNA ligase [Acidobacteriota bacterium]
MIDRRLIRETPEVVRKALQDRGSDFDLDRLIEVEARRRELLGVEALKAEKNGLSKQIGATIQSGGDPEPLKARVAELSARIVAMEEELVRVDQELDRMMLDIPNIPLPSVPVGASEEDNVVVKTWGEPRSFDFTARGHWEIGESLGILSFEKAARMAGARFVCNIGLGATLERSLINFFLDTHTRKHGYTEVLPPILSNAESLIGTSSLPKFEDDLFKTREGYYLIPTAEVPLTNMHQGEIIEGDLLPLYYTAYTPCFRSEAGSAGRETRGMIRQHQFHKVELMKFVKPGQGDEELEKLTCNAEAILQMLDLPHRRLALCTGDITFGSAQTYDLEVWMPGMNTWLEISSCSQYGDFQARRCNTRYRPQPGARPEYVHTMNGSGLAAGRTVAAILENYQTAEGTVVIPEVLRPYMGGVSEIFPPER